MEEERNDNKSELWSPESWGQKLLVLWKLTSLLLINAGQQWSHAWVCWISCSLCINRSCSSVQGFKSNTISTVKICQLFGNWCPEFPTFHSRIENSILQTSLPIVNILLSSDLCIYGSWMEYQPFNYPASMLPVLLLPLYQVVTGANIPQ